MGSHKLCYTFGTMDAQHAVIAAVSQDTAAMWFT
jgi:hypothetical protein